MATPSIQTGSPAAVVDLPAPYLSYTTASAGTNGADMDNSNCRGVVVFVNISAITGTTPTFTVTIQGKDKVSGQYYTLLASAALNATGLTVLRVYPGIAVSANVTANDVVPSQFRVITAIGGTGPAVTATVSGCLIP